MYKILVVIALFLVLPAIALGQLSDDGKPVKPITDADIVGAVTFHPDTVYVLDGFVFVDAGEVLNILPGTIIKANPGQAELASALIVSPGGQIFALGTQSEPIVFTSTQDDLDDPADIPPGDAGRKLWGGVIILGNATINTTSGVGNIEGLPPSPRTEYGGNNDNDNSGVLEYVSIRHGGSVFGTADEINGLTLGGVGDGTTINFVEIFQNFDDGVEWFGGTVRLKHVVVAFCGDDSYDIDEGWSGGVQYAFTIMDEEDSDNAGEHDGGTTPEDGAPFATPLFSNVTYLGAGAAASTSKNPRAFTIRDNCSPAYYNSIFSDHNGCGISIEQSAAEPTDSEDRLLAGDLVFENNVWGLFQVGTAPIDLACGQPWTETLFTNPAFNNLILDPLICVSRLPDSLNDPRPQAPSLPPWTDPTVYNPPVKPGFGATFAGFFDPVDYVGAFDPNEPIADNWMRNWTAFDFYGYLGACEEEPCLADGDSNGDSMLTVNDMTHLLNFLYSGGPAPTPLHRVDVTGDCVIDTFDVKALGCVIFGGCDDPPVLPVETCCDPTVIDPSNATPLEDDSLFALGDAVVTTNKAGAFTVENIGNSGFDGARVQLANNKRSIGMGIDGVDLAVEESEFSFRIASYLDDLVKDSRTTTLGYAVQVGFYSTGSTVQITADFIGLGDPNVKIKVFNGGTLTGEITVPGGGVVAFGTEGSPGVGL
ncbi:hypothetical protein GF420_10645, partial [candidate division GN15 bacterium]|nr:hypothetical protein [candidate division GN15 bacterium]